VRFHDLRHSALSLMLERCQDVTSVSRAAGHSTITLTVNTYGQTSQNAVGRALATLADVVPVPREKDQNT
jgi:integrase